MMRTNYLSHWSRRLLVFSVCASLAFVMSSPALAGADACQSALALSRQELAASFAGNRASVLIAQGSHVLLRASWGAGVSSDTRFLLGSISKTLQGLVASRLMVQGKVGLTDRVIDWLPVDSRAGLPEVWSRIRVQELLHHTSGIVDYMNELPPSGFLSTPRTFAEIFHRIPPALHFSPESSLSYSNSNYYILSKVLELRTGSPYPELYRSELVQALGLVATGLEIAPDHSIWGGSGNYPANMMGVGNSVSTTNELMKVLTALDGESFLPREQVQALFTGSADCTGGSVCGRYGLGWSLRDDAIQGRKLVIHEGHLSSVSAVVAKIPDLKLNVAIVSDRGRYLLEAPVTAILDRLVSAGCVN